MSYSFMQMGVAFTLSVLIGQWIGLIGLAKGNRNDAWKCMVAGTILSTLGALSWFGRAGLDLVRNADGFTGYLAIAATVLSALGSVLFAVGFAFMGSLAARSSQRVTELEAIAHAQGEELNRLRATQGSAS